MAKRVALTSLLPATSAALEPEHPQQDVPPTTATEPEATPAAAVPAQQTATAAPTRPAPHPESSAPATPRPRQASRTPGAGHQHFSQLTRKEARLRNDQIDNLAVQARRLSRAKNDTTERITDNTLIRIAVDLLLADPSRLRGSTEAELRNSVGL